MSNLIAKAKTKLRRKLGIRKLISGVDTKPRISIAKSNKWVFVQAIDDIAQVTLASAKVAKGVKNMETAAQELAKVLKTKKVENAVFDRNGFRYHGNVKAFADSLRNAGIKI